MGFICSPEQIKERQCLSCEESKRRVESIENLMKIVWEREPMDKNSMELLFNVIDNCKKRTKK